MKLNRRKFCECGCGQRIKKDKRFIHGHNQIGKINPHNKRPPKSPPQLCLCGCGEMTTPNHRYLRGHSNELKRKNPPLSQPQPCECGCGRMTKAGRRFISGHNPSWNKNKKGAQIAWNKGLTKTTDERVAKYAQNKKGKKRPDMVGELNINFKRKGILHHAYGKPAWNSGLTKNNHPSILKMSKSLEGSKPWNKGVKGYKTKPCSERQKRILSLLKRGKNNPMYGKSKELSPTWKGGCSFAPYPLEWTNKLKNQIRARDKYTCQICNSTQKKLKEQLTVHHINYIKKDCSPENLISLCRNCHSKTNFHRNKWMMIFNRKMRNRYKFKI